MRRLGSATLSEANSGVRRPAYDWRGVGIGMAHLGVGAFHRCHQAVYTDDMLEARGGDWGIVGVNLRPPLLAGALGVQDGLYARRLRDDSGIDECRIIGCIRQTIDAQDDSALTITEKGYCHIPATGALDDKHPDIVHDLRRPDAPHSAPAILVAALERRRLAGAAGLTLLSCDNIPSNGLILSGIVRALAQARSPALARWIADHVAFPSSMVDRIVPATTDADIDAIGDILGLSDRACVVGEPFRQWTIEDRFIGIRPPWDLAGAEFVGDVSPYERVKMRVLNGAQTTLCYLGALAGLDYTFEDVRHPVLERFVRTMLEEETAPTLPEARGMEARAYIDLSDRKSVV